LNASKPRSSFQRRTDPSQLFCPCFGRCDILVVDDNVFNIMTLQTMLEVSLKLKSDRALNGKEAVELIKRRM
jgi:PleD family two-component response regulator